MPSIALQSPGGNTVFESLGPHFFPRIIKKEMDKSGGDDPDAALREKYLIELSATGLELFEAKNLENEQWETIGSATVSMIEARFQDAGYHFKGCTIEQLDVKTGNNVTDTVAFAAILRVIQSLSVKCGADHLAMIRIEGSCWSSGLLKYAGLNLCDCLLPQDARVDFQLCMALPASNIERTRMENPFIREKDGVEAAASNTQSVTKIAKIRGETVATTMHDPRRLEPYNMQLPYEDRRKNTTASETDVETSLAGPSSATDTNNNTNAVNATAGPGVKIDTREAPAADLHANHGGMQVPTEESSEVKDSGEQEQPKARGKGRHRNRHRKKTRAHNTHLGSIEEGDE